MVSDGLPFMFIGYGFGGFPSFSNSGTLWSSGIAAAVFRALNLERFDNAGVIVADATTEQAIAVTVESSLRQGISNSGSIYAFSEGGAAYAVQDWSAQTLTNSGLLAARSGVSAVAVFRHNGGHVSNSETGLILAEGPGATALRFIGVPAAPPEMGNPPSLSNAGLIEAFSTDPERPSTAIMVANSEFGAPFRVENSGIIRGDFTIYSNENWFTFPTSRQSVTNLSTGLIEGAMWLGLGEDLVLNAGAIRGVILMGGGDDLFDTASGRFDGVADMGWGDDRFIGSADGNLVFGDRGADSLFGGAGDDLLIGGRGDDFLQGDEGNDGLYGDYGDDHILTKGGDRADGGGGNDRIEIGDYGFSGVFGGDGIDTLVLPAGARTIDIRQMLATGRVGGFEAIELSGAKQIAIREGDIAAMTGGASRLVVRGDATDKIDLVGAWTANGPQIIGGVTYQAYSLNGAQLLVAGETAITIVASATPGSSGLDAVATGAEPPAPGGDTGIDLSSSSTSVAWFKINGDLTIEADETWSVPITPDFQVALNGGERLTNFGTILSNGMALNGRFLSVQNEGLIGVSSFTGIDKVSEYTSRFQTYGVDRIVNNVSAIGLNVDLGGPGTSIINNGTIDVDTDQLAAVGINSYLLSEFQNHADIKVDSTYFVAVGVYAHNGGHLVNSGTIAANGVVGAYGIGVATHVAEIENSGTIVAQASGSAAPEIGVYFYYQLGTSSLKNSGTITADIAIQTSWNVNGGALRLINSGDINGRIELNVNPNGSPPVADVILNTGSINGSVMLGGGNDLYDGRGGRQTGTIHGESGRDILIGTEGADRIDGGSDDDILIGDGGDTLTGGAGRDTFIFSHVTSTIAQITDFVSGVDRINLSAIEPISVTLARSGGNTRITAVTASGNLVINVTGQVFDSDIERFGPGNGTSGSDVLVASGSGAALSGLEGDDFLFGFGGADTLDGGAGTDFMAGGAGDDTYIVDNVDDIVFERDGQGFDTIRLSGISTFAIPDGVERLIGGNEDNYLIGSARNDILDGGAGKDTVYLRGARSDYHLTQDGDAYTLIDQRAGSPGGTDTLLNIEFLNFDGENVAIANMLDSTAPSIASVSPLGGAVNVGTTSNIVVTFDEAIARGNGSIVLLRSDGTVVEKFDTATSDRISVTGPTLTIDPVHALSAGTHYVVKIWPGAVRDLFGNDFAATSSYDFTTAANPSPPGDSARFVLLDGFIGSIGPDGHAFGTKGFQDLTIIDQPGQLMLDGSFSTGGDVVRLAGTAADYTARVQGSYAILFDGDSEVGIPIGDAGIALVFSDGLRTLIYSDGAVRIGSQTVDAAAAVILAQAEASPVPTGTALDLPGRLILNADGVAAVAGDFDIFGTRDGHEVVEIQAGAVILDGSFGAGGDIVILQGLSAAFSARITGSNVSLHSAGIDATIPIGSAGLTLRFIDGDQVLRYDALTQTVRIGSQAIGQDAVNLPAFSPPGSQSLALTDHVFA